MFKNLTKNQDFGLFLARFLLGLILILYGVSYLKAGNSAFKELGKYASYLGINFAYSFWGFLGMLMFSAGGFCIIIGFLFRWMCFGFFLMMLSVVLKTYSGFALLTFDLKMPYCVAAAAIALSFIFIGPGSWSVDGSSSGSSKTSSKSSK